jgi:5'-3' exonuclease
MGIKNLKSLINNICAAEVRHYSSVDEFIKSEAKRLVDEHIQKNKITNPVKKIQVQKDFANKIYRIGIDANLFAVRYKRVFKRIEYGFLRQIMLSLAAGMKPFYVFDGLAPPSKRKTINHRGGKKQKNKNRLDEVRKNNVIKQNKLAIDQMGIDELIDHIENLKDQLFDIDNKKNESNNDSNAKFDAYQTNFLLANDEENSDLDILRLTKKSISVSHDDIKALQKFFDLLHIPWITALGEADNALAGFYKAGIIDACQSDDMDMLPKGCGNLIQIDNKGVSQFILTEILDGLGLTYTQFVDLCILLGSDYDTPYLPKLKASDLYEIFKKGPSIDQFVAAFAELDPNIVIHLEEYKDIRNEFIDLDEIKNSHLSSHKLSPICLDQIKSYFDDNGIYLGADNYNKFKVLARQANKFINRST